MGEIIRYCRQDAIVLFEAAQAFFLKVYTTPVGHGFVSKMFYHSLSALAYDTFNSCFLKDVILTNPAVTIFEQRLKKGGHTCPYGGGMIGIGVMIDINSEYPAAQCNPMPIDYEYLDERALQ